MRKQTKVVAVASAAALLAIGGAMTSFAAQGWVEEDGTWYYYDKDGSRVENEWKKSGDNWFWLDGEDGGAMATDKLIDDDDNTYYVDSNGVMVNVTVNLDGSSYSFNFQKTGSATSGRGQGVTGIDDKKYVYNYGCRIKADSDDKYQLVEIWNSGTGNTSINTANVHVEKLDAPAFTHEYTNKENENVNAAIPKAKHGGVLRLVNTTGNIQKNKTAVKDGNDCYYYVDSYEPKLYTDNKTLKAADKDSSVTDWKTLVADMKKADKKTADTEADDAE